jgi:hypothetical protein
MMDLNVCGRRRQNPGRMKEQVKIQIAVSEPKFEIGISKIRRRSANCKPRGQIWEVSSKFIREEIIVILLEMLTTYRFKTLCDLHV